MSVCTLQRGRNLVTISPTQSVTARLHTAAAGDATAARPAAEIVKAPGPYVQFESFVLQSFIQSMMPAEGSQIYGEGTAGEVWKSMLAEKMAKEIAEHGGIGIAKMIAPKDGAVAATGQPEASRQAAVQRVADWQMTSVLQPQAAGGLFGDSSDRAD